MAAVTEGLAAQQAFQRQKATPQYAVAKDGFTRIVRAARREPAMRAEQRRNQPLI